MTEPSSALPAGWDETRLRNATPQDLEALSAEDFALIQQHAANRIRLDLGASEATDPNALASPDVDQTSPEATKYTAPFVDALRVTALLGDNWGFTVFRLDYSSGTDAAWNAYTHRLAEELEMAVYHDEIYAEDGMDEARAGLGVLWAEDSKEEVHGQGLEAIRQEFRIMRNRGDVPDGMNHGVCLVADLAAIRSLERASSRLPISAYGVQDPPYVLAVDADWNGGGRMRDEDEYAGCFKVAVASLLPELFPLLSRGILTPKELALMVEEDEVWTGIV